MSIGNLSEPDLAVFFSLGKQFLQLLEGADPSQNRRRTLHAILSDITVGHIEIKMAIDWLLQTGQFNNLSPSEGPLVTRMRLNSLQSDLSSIFSPLVVQSTLAFLSGYLGFPERDILILGQPSLSPGLPRYSVAEPEGSSTPSQEDDEDDESDLLLTSAEAVELLPYLPLTPLEGNELIDRINQFPDASKRELVALCGHYEYDGGRIRLRFTDFYQSLIVANFRRDNPDSGIVDFPVRVLDNGRIIKINGTVARKHGLRDGHYRISFGATPPGGLALTLSPLEATESSYFEF